jgi:hypothetical protein
MTENKKTNASTTSSSSTVTILIMIIRAIHYEISLTQQMQELFQTTNRKKQTN